jgi:hypothetical protein
MKNKPSHPSSYRLPGNLSDFQEQLYIHLIDWKWENITRDAGYYLKRTYDAILPESCVKDGVSQLIYDGIRESLVNHRKRNDFRIHKHFNHMASSQAACINLFLPILHHGAAGAVLGSVKSDFASVAETELDNGYCLEFWGDNFNGGNPGGSGTGPLGDKSAMAGTDADLAIAYYNHEGELCLWLIEHKLTEKEFTTCGGFKSNGRVKTEHDCGRSFTDILADKNLCYYHDKRNFRYWDLTEENRDFFKNHGDHASCPFKGGMNQLWRNQLLGLAIEKDPDRPFRHVYLSVVRHPENKALDPTLSAYRKLINGNPKFSDFTSADFIRATEKHGDANLMQWAKWYKNLYQL